MLRALAYTLIQMCKPHTSLDPTFWFLSNTVAKPILHTEPRAPPAVFRVADPGQSSQPDVQQPHASDLPPNHDPVPRPGGFGRRLCGVQANVRGPGANRGLGEVRTASSRPT